MCSLLTHAQVHVFSVPSSCLVFRGGEQTREYVWRGSVSCDSSGFNIEEECGDEDDQDGVDAVMMWRKEQR